MDLFPHESRRKKKKKKRKRAGESGMGPRRERKRFKEIV